jgi:hypothetical protein
VQLLTVYDRAVKSSSAAARPPRTRAGDDAEHAIGHELVERLLERYERLSFANNARLAAT